MPGSYFTRGEISGNGVPSHAPGLDLEKAGVRPIARFRYDLFRVGWQPCNGSYPDPVSLDLASWVEKSTEDEGMFRPGLGV